MRGNEGGEGITLRVRVRAVDPRVEQIARRVGFEPLLARIVAGRIPLQALGDDVSGADARLRRLMAPKLSQLDDPRSLADIDLAAARICKAIDGGERIGLSTDHDADGVTSCAVLTEALTKIFGHPDSAIERFIGHRLNEGYGLSDPLVDRILAASPRPALLITADNGSSDERRIARLAAAGIDVLVTDHHELPQNGGQPQPPNSAYAVVTPQHPRSRYPDRQVAGCLVAWLVVSQVFRHRVRQGLLSPDETLLKALLGFVAIGTVADCVSLGTSANNRAVVRAGLEQIQTASRPAFAVIRAKLCPRGEPVRAETLAYQVCPRLASPGRLAVADPGIKFLLAQSEEEAQQWWLALSETNEARKRISRQLEEPALSAAQRQLELGRSCFVISLGEEGHAGIHGLVAARIAQRFGRPTVVFSVKPRDPALLAGSCRSIPGVNIRQCLQDAHDAAPGVMVYFGGHEMAAGLTLEARHLEGFASLLERSVSDQLRGRDLTPVINTDGPLPMEALSLNALSRIRKLEPFGQRFEQPTFSGTWRVNDVRPCGPEQTHLRLVLNVAGRPVPAVWFRAREPGQPVPVSAGQMLSAVVEVADTFWRGRSLQLLVRQPIDAIQLEPAVQPDTSVPYRQELLSGHSAEAGDPASPTVDFTLE